MRNKAPSRDTANKGNRLLLKVISVSLIAFFMSTRAGVADFYSDTEIADAIYLAEGASLAKKPYGILSVRCEGEQECRKVCLNTIRNNRKRYADYGHKQYDTFLEFLWHRYAPPEAHPLNKNWLKNVLYFLKKGR